MAELSEQEPISESARQAVAAVDALYHGDFQNTLTGIAYSDFLQSLGAIAASKPSGIGELLVQFFVVQNREELQDNDQLSYIGLMYDFVQIDNPEVIKLQARFVMVPNDNRDLVENEEYANTPTIVVNWHDINWPNVPIDGYHSPE